jgi:hypothetical protein
MQVHMSAPNVDQFIDLLISIPAEGYDNSFTYVMSEWTKQQGKFPNALVWFRKGYKCIQVAV